MSRPIITEFEGYQLLLTRRRYSNATFTWVNVNIGGEWVSLGDPWQSINPPQQQLREAIKLALAPTGGADAQERS